jgi:hypothetical protein
MTKEYAAGTNLFNANHVVFLSPFFSTSEDDYAEKKLQAIRRVYRQGQVKPVTVHNFVGVSKSLFRTALLTRFQVALDTIDVDVYEQREGFGLVREGEAVERRRGAASNCGLNLRLDLRHAAEFDFE